jgi:hypothetical protein
MDIINVAAKKSGRNLAISPIIRPPVGPILKYVFSYGFSPASIDSPPEKYVPMSLKPGG